MTEHAARLRSEEQRPSDPESWPWSGSGPVVSSAAHGAGDRDGLVFSPEESALRLAPLLLDALLDPTRWPAALAVLAEAFGAAAAKVCIGDGASRDLLVGFFSPLPEAAVTAFLEFGGYADDPRLRHGIAHPGTVWQTHEVVPRARWRNSSAYRDLFRPGGFDNTLGVVLAVPGTRFAVSLALLQPPGAPPFGPREVALLEALVPHLERIARLLVERHLAASERATLRGALDGLGTPTLVVASTGRILLANAAAQAALSARAAVADLGGHLAATDPAAAGALRRAVRAAAAAGSGGPGREARRHLALPDGEGRALNAAVSPVIAEPFACDLPLGEVAAALVQLSVPGAGGALDEDVLSPAEAEVTLRLARGAAPREIAAATGRRYETVRTLLKRAMGKTGTARQADLVRCVAGHPGA